VAGPVTIQGELRLPAPFLQGREMDVVERELQGYGLLPGQVGERRWRMDPEAPGGYILAFTCALSVYGEEGR
jgi:hypothetical protein